VKGTVGELKQILKDYPDDERVFIYLVNGHHSDWRKHRYDLQSVSPAFDQDTNKASAVFNIINHYLGESE
jgi:hypothetical protein